MADFYKFPHTPYLLPPSKEIGRKDKILTESEAKEFFSKNVLVEEKIDGANLGISFQSDGTIFLQNRGHQLDEPYYGQWEPLSVWLSSRENALLEVLEDRYILFGEWCYVTHSIHYNSLPDWFIAFDIYDKVSNQFLSANRRNLLIREAGMTIVPQLFEGHISIESLDSLICKSAFGQEECEGLYFRIDSLDFLLHRAKYVRNDFSQAISTHWSKKRVIHNQLG